MNELESNSHLEIDLENESEKAITYIYLLRHSNRYAGKNEITTSSGEVVTIVDPETLSPEGIEAAKNFGKTLNNFDLVHTLSSNEERAQQTGDFIKEGSGVVGKKRKELNLNASPTRKVAGISYKEVDSDTGIMKKVKKIIVDNLSNNFAELSPEERAKARELPQEKGLEILLDSDKKMAEQSAEGVAYQLVHAKNLAKRGVKIGTKVAIPIITHGTFPEALFKKALVIEDKETGQKTIGFNNPSEIGGFMKQLDGIEIKLTIDNSNEKIDYQFTDSNRRNLFNDKKIYLDWSIIESLAKNYLTRTK